MEKSQLANILFSRLRNGFDNKKFKTECDIEMYIQPKFYDVAIHKNVRLKTKQWEIYYIGAKHIDINEHK